MRDRLAPDCRANCHRAPVRPLIRAHMPLPACGDAPLLCLASRRGLGISSPPRSRLWAGFLPAEPSPAFYLSARDEPQPGAGPLGLHLAAFDTITDAVHRDPEFACCLRDRHVVHATSLAY